MPFFKKPLAGPAWIVLNILRVINIITLTATTAASFAMLIKTFNVSKFFFFDGVSHLITGSLSLALIITEIGLFKRYIALNWPLLCPSSGFVTLGFLMIFLGISILGNLNKTATSEKSLGSSFWSLTIAAGILILIAGVANVVVSYVFRSKSLGITARQYRKHGNEADRNPYFWPPMSKGAKGSRSYTLSSNRTSATLPTYQTDAKPMYQRPSVRSISSPLPTARTPTYERTDAPGGSKIQRPESTHPALRGEMF